jgi:RNA polymerase sigma factor (sigma-70 family)
MTHSIHPRSSAATTAMLDVLTTTPERVTGWLHESGAISRDMELSARLGRLERGAWTSFYLEHRRLVSAVLAAAVGHGEGLDDDDLVQEVFVTAVSLVRSGRVGLHGDPVGLRAWLLAITRRVARTEARSRRRTRARRTEYDWEGHGVPAADPALVQALGRARALLATLPDRLRIPWILRHFERMTINETALATGVSSATVKRRLGRAEKRFRRLAQADPAVRDYLRHGGST